MNIRIYIGKNTDLPRVAQSFEYIRARIALSELSEHHVEVIESSSDKFEYPALDKCWEDSQHTDFYGLYIHCKGASKSDEKEFMNGLAWLHYMLFGLVNNSKACIEHMDKGADLVGCMWYRHFKGNCFWFKSSYVRNLTRPMSLNIANRYSAEYWCSQAYWSNPGAALPKVKNLFYLPIASDADFLGLVENNYIADMTYTNQCTELSQVIARNDYSIFDELIITKEEQLKYADVLDKYMNYNGRVSLK